MKRSIVKVSMLLVLMTGGVSLALERIPGTRIALDPPEGFEPSTRFLGYAHGVSSSSIMASELPVAFTKMVDGFTKEALATRGMTLIDRHDTQIGDRPAALYHVSQEASGTLFYKWLLLFGDEQVTEMVTAVFPQRSAEQWSEPLKQTLLNIQWQKDAKPDAFEGLGYRIQEQGDLKIASKIGTTLLLTRNGVIPREPNDDPYLTIAPSFTQNWQIPDDIRAYTKARLFLMGNLCSDPQITREERVRHDGLPGYQLEAVCADPRSGEALALWHTMIFSDEGYYLFLAVARDTDKAAYAAIFQSVIDSFERI
ncbi:MAG: hypothetical protein ABW068_15250 [Candidatus Thiodiazotropha sp.]